MHKACHPVCQDLARNDVTIEAAPQANPLSVHPPSTMEIGSSMCSVNAILPCSPLIAPAFLTGSVDNLPPIRDNACYCLRDQTRHSHCAPFEVMQIHLIHAMQRRLARQVSEAMQYHSDMPINREDAPAGALFQHL